MVPTSPGKWKAMIYSWVLGFERSPADGIPKQPDIYRRSPFPSLPRALWTNGCLLEMVILFWVILRAAW